jgi:hypothetical protein
VLSQNWFISADLAFRADPLRLERLREQFLPECAIRGRDSKKFQYAVLAAAAVHGGTEPDLLDEVSWWQTDDFWQYFDDLGSGSPPWVAADPRSSMGLG